MRKPLLLVLLGVILTCSKTAQSQCIVDIGADTGICYGSSIKLKADVISGSPTKYNWSSIPAGTAATTNSITVSPTSTTTYIVRASGGGCNAHDTIVVSVSPAPVQPTFNYNINNSCAGIIGNFSTPSQGPNIHITWNFGDSAIATGANVSHIYNPFVGGATTFTVTATASVGSCTANYSRQVSIPKKSSANLQPGPGVDTSSFNGSLTFNICAAAAQQMALFTFVNGLQSTGYSTTILWGDTGKAFTSNTAWTTVNHIYRRGLYKLTYVVTNDTTGCTDTSYYKVFYGSNPAGGIASPGNTDICGPDWLTFMLTNYQANTAGTIYTVQFSDSTPPLIFNHPPPDSISHYFQRASCGFTSSNGITTFPNSFSASLTVQNPCGLTAGAVVPIYVSIRPKADFSYSAPCVNTPITLTNTSTNGMAASSSGCNNQTPILWSIIPDTGFSITSGSMGSDNGYTGDLFNPVGWTSGSQTLSVNFTAAGNYQFQIIAGNKCSADTMGKGVCVSAAPSPAISVTTLSGCAPLFDTISNITPPPAGCSAPLYSWAINQGGAYCTQNGGNSFNFLNGTTTDSTTAFLQFNNPGNYNVSLNAENVCGTFTSTTIVNVKVKPQVGINVPATACNGDQVNPTASIQACGGTVSNYNWSFPGGNPASSTNQNPGNITYAVGQYNLSLTASNECGSANGSAHIRIDTIPFADAGPDKQICSGSNTQIGTAPVSGNQYSWSPSNGLSASNIANPTITVTNNGTSPVTKTFYLTVSNNSNCSSSDTVQVTIYPPATVNAGPDAGVCTGQDITLAGTFGGSATSVSWASNNGGAFTDATSPTSGYTPSISSGSVVLTLTTDDPTGPCPAVSNTMTVFAVAPPVANAGPNVTVCSGMPIQIGSANQNGYTYHWTPATGLSNANISNPTATINNFTSTAFTQTYKLNVSAAGCSDTASVTVTVNPAATANAGSPASTCAGAQVNLSGSIGGAANSATWSSTGGTFGSAGSLSTTFTPTVSSGTVTVYLITDQPSANCPADTATVLVTVKPVPVISLIPINQTICSGTAFQDINISSGVPGTSYNWSGTSPDGITGFVATGTAATIPARILNSPSSSTGAVIYTVAGSAAGCVAAPVTDTIFVSAALTINTPAPQTICSGTSTAPVTLTSNATGVTYTWTASADNYLGGFTGNGTGNIPAQTITNTSNNTDTVVYTVLASGNGCNGASTSFNVMVNPPLQAILPPAQHICSGATAQAVNLSATIPGANFSWTAVASGAITGYADSGTGYIPAQTISNAGNTTGNVTYTITTTGSGCTGSIQSYVITVDPQLTVTANPSTDSVCTGTQINISLSSNNNSATFNWVVTAPGSVNGASDGNGNAIQQLLTNNSQTAQQVQYIVTPISTTCAGNPDTVMVYVKPGVIVQFTSDIQSVCSGQATQLVNISSPNGGIGFNWSSVSSGVTGVLASGKDSIPSQVLINNTLSADTIIYLVVPDSTGCPGQTAPYYIVVQPAPNVILPGSQTICSGASTQAISLSSGTANTSFSWVGSSTTVTGFIASGTGGSIPPQTLTNTTQSAAQLTYSVTPVANTCNGVPVNYIITVNPTPSLSPITPQNICTGTPTAQVDLTSPVNGTIFSWTSVAASTIVGNSTSGTGSIPAQTLYNSGVKTDSVIYTITPNARGCGGTATNFAVLVSPKPTIVVPSISQTVCSGQLTQDIVLSSPNPGASITWSAQVPKGITGAVTSGTNTIPAQTLYNTSVDTFSNTLTIQYTIQLTNSNVGCSTASGKYAISVKPKPIVDFNLNNTGGCSPVAVYVVPKTFNFVAPDSVTFRWGDGTPNTVVHPSSAKPMWAPVQHNYYNMTGLLTTYNIDMVAHTACTDTMITHPVTINPSSVNAFFTTSVPTGCEPLAVDFTDQSSSGASLSWCFDYDKANNICRGGGTVSKAGAVVSHTFTAGTYTIALYASQGTGCANDTVYQTIYVSPAPKVNFAPSTTLCEQTEVNFANSTIIPDGSFINQYGWKFGDGASSALESPSHTYDTAGTYPVCLTTTSSSGCTDTMCKTVTIEKRPKAYFSLPDACVNQQHSAFTNLSTGATFYKWIFGDGSTSVDVAPQHPYLQAGTYTVQLVGIAKSCTDTAARSITIHPLPKASFKIPSGFSCGLPSTIALTNLSEGAIGYHWDFANGTVSDYPEPSVIYTTQGTYDISLAATNQYGCSDTTHNPISVYPFPVIKSVNVKPDKGCQPVRVVFTVNAVNAQNFTWDFGDGQTDEGKSPIVAHLYTEVGSYSVIIRAYSYSACGDTLSLLDTVNVHVRPVADFNYIVDNEGQTANGTVQFTNNSSNSTQYLWDFRDGETATETNPAHVFANIDQFDVMLVASNNYGCSDTAFKNIEVIKKSLFTPNAFAPDFHSGSDLVRVWKPSGTGLRDYHAQIFNKWGELLWESTLLTADLEPAEGWDGTYQGKVCEQDVYVWKIQAVFTDGTRWSGMSYQNQKVKKTIGSVTLVR